MSKTLIIDPGHGGTDPGANGFNVKEKEWTFIMSLYQYERLKELGADVALTRNRDRTLEPGARTALIRDKYDYCMSNHFNAYNGQARGVEAIHSIYSDGKVASKLAKSVCNASGLPLRRVFDRKGSNGKDYYFIQRETGKTESIILEYGFIDNRQDHDFYKNMNNFFIVAEAVVNAWCEVLGVTYKPRQKKPPGNPSTKIYRVQVGAFKERENAETLAQKLIADGYPAIVLDK